MKEIILSSLDVSRIRKSIEEAIRKKSIGQNEASTLANELLSAKIVEPEKIPGNIVTMNSIVKVSFLNTKKTLQIQIVYPENANFRENRI